MMKTIKLSELFDIERGVRLTKAEQEPGNIPLVTAGEDNYGINGYISNGKSKLFKNAITVDMFCHAVYRDYEFYCDDNIIVLTPKNEMKLNELLYYSLCICQNKYKFGYGRQLRLSRLDEIKLPVKIPDWVYEVEEPDLSKYKESFNNNPTPELNTDTWKEFKLTDLFIIKGSKTTKLPVLEEIGPGEYPYITTKSTNNGVDGYYNIWTEKGNVLTVDSACVGTCFYQEHNFTAADHVEKLIPKFEMNKYNALFLATIINQSTFKYSYGRGRSKTRLEKETIKLPTTPEGEPDYQFMENYIKTLPYSKYI